MDDVTAATLLGINQQFYQTFALQFSATRQRIQPGVRRILAIIPPEAKILDLGCGNGELARELARRGHTGAYLGLDFSAGLLDVARANLPGEQFRFEQADLAAALNVELPALSLSKGSTFNVVLTFAVLHHIPGLDLRQKLLHNARAALAPSGRLIHSEWQFLNSPRLATRIQPWEMIGLAASDVDPADYLLDWRGGGSGLRYVHHFSEAELAELACQTGFTIAETFYADGETGNLGLYQTWNVNVKR